MVAPLSWVASNSATGVIFPVRPTWGVIDKTLT